MRAPTVIETGSDPEAAAHDSRGTISLPVSVACWPTAEDGPTLEKVFTAAGPRADYVDTTMSTGPIERCLSCHPSQGAHRSRRLANFMFTAASVSVVWFTITSWRRDDVFAPNTITTAAM